MGRKGVKIGDIYYPTSEEKGFLIKREEICNWFNKNKREDYESKHYRKYAGVGENKTIYVGDTREDVRDMAKGDKIPLFWIYFLSNDIEIFSPEFHTV